MYILKFESRKTGQRGPIKKTPVLEHAKYWVVFMNTMFPNILHWYEPVVQYEHKDLHMTKQVKQ